MSAQDEIMNITATITEVIATEVNVLATEELIPVTTAEILNANFGNDDEAEFIQGFLEITNIIEQIILSDTPDDFLCPTEDNDLPPAFLMLEMLDDLKNYKFAGRTIDRMERRIRGVNEVVKVKMTETDKASHPDYKKCPDCLRHFAKRYLGFHMGTDICVKVKTAHNLRPSGSDKKKVSEKIYNACYDLEDLYSRAVSYHKNIEPELIEETMEDEVSVDEENTPKRSIKITYSNGKVEWQNDKDGRIEWDYDDREIDKLLKDAIEWGKTQDGLESICLVETSSDGSSRELTKTKYEETMEDEVSVEESSVKNYEYIVKTYIYDAPSTNIEYAGLWENDSWVKCWTSKAEATTEFEDAIATGDFISVELIQIDPDANEDRETCIDDWEDTLSDYVESEDTDDELEEIPVGTKIGGKTWDGKDYQTDEEEN